MIVNITSCLLFNPERDTLIQANELAASINITVVKLDLCIKLENLRRSWFILTEWITIPDSINNGALSNAWDNICQNPKTA